MASKGKELNFKCPFLFMNLKLKQPCDPWPLYRTAELYVLCSRQQRSIRNSRSCDLEVTACVCCEKEKVVPGRVGQCSHLLFRRSLSALKGTSGRDGDLGCSPGIVWKKPVTVWKLTPRGTHGPLVPGSDAESLS